MCSPRTGTPALPRPRAHRRRASAPDPCDRPVLTSLTASGLGDWSIAGVDLGPIVSSRRDGVASGPWTWRWISGTARFAASSRTRCGWPSGPAAATGIGAAPEPGSGRAAERVPRGGGGQLRSADHRGLPVGPARLRHPRRRDRGVRPPAGRRRPGAECLPLRATARPGRLPRLPARRVEGGSAACPARAAGQPADLRRPPRCSRAQERLPDTWLSSSAWSSTPSMWSSAARPPRH